MYPRGMCEYCFHSHRNAHFAVVGVVNEIIIIIIIMSKFNYSMGIASLEWLEWRAPTPPRSRYSARSCEFEGHIAYMISKVHRTVFFLL